MNPFKSIKLQNFQLIRLHYKTKLLHDTLILKSPYSSGWTPLHLASRAKPETDALDCVTFLINEGADVNRFVKAKCVLIPCNIMSHINLRKMSRFRLSWRQWNFCLMRGNSLPETDRFLLISEKWNGMLFYFSSWFL